MKLTLCLLALVSSAAFAQSSWQTPSTNSYESLYRSEPSYQQYRGATGTQYQYDLSRPGDRLRYGLDTPAQMRDQLSVDPRRDLDRSLGQHGGGIRR